MKARFRSLFVFLRRIQQTHIWTIGIINRMTFFICIPYFFQSRKSFHLAVWSHQMSCYTCINSSPVGQNGRYFTDDLINCISVNEKFCISIRIAQKFVPKGPINKKSALVQVMAWRRTGASHYLNQCWPCSPTHICGTRGDELRYNGTRCGR